MRTIAPRRFCANVQYIVRAPSGGAIELGQALLNIAAHLRLDETERHEGRLVDDLDGEEVVGVAVTCGYAGAAERAGGAGEVDSVCLQALRSGGELGLGERDFNHASSVRVSAAEAILD